MSYELSQVQRIESTSISVVSRTDVSAQERFGGLFVIGRKTPKWILVRENRHTKVYDLTDARLGVVELERTCPGILAEFAEISDSV